MKKFNFFILLVIFVEISASIFDFNEVKNNILQWTNLSFPNLSEVSKGGGMPEGLFDLSDIKNKFLQWKSQKLAAFCPSNSVHLQNLLNVACTSALATNTTLRDSCISCFSAVTAMPEGPRELSALSQCANRYFVNTPYAVCSAGLATLATSALNVQTAGCYMGYCDLAKCLRRINSLSLIIQCTREARTGVNLMMDADNVRFFTNVTSCILAKARCGTFNSITGSPQTPGYTAAGVKVSNALQITEAGDLRVMAFPATTPVSTAFCTTPFNLTQANWLTNVC